MTWFALLRNRPFCEILLRVISIGLPCFAKLEKWPTPMSAGLPPLGAVQAAGRPRHLHGLGSES